MEQREEKKKMTKIGSKIEMKIGKIQKLDIEQERPPMSKQNRNNLL